MRKMIALILAGVLLVGSAYARCKYNDTYTEKTNFRACGYPCGFLGTKKQNVWDVITWYHCVSNTTHWDSDTTENVHPHTCCAN